jgi:signal transduction histidine kinase
MYDLYRPGKEAAREFSVNEVIRDVVSFLNISCQWLRDRKKTIEVETGDAPILVTMEESSFRQIVYNLIDNAIDASPEGEAVRVTASVMKDTLNITVSDRGEGIPEEFHSRVFDPFFTTKDSAGKRGMGLGLSVCKSFVEKMGGTIDFTTETGKGTAFKITLPI